MITIAPTCPDQLMVGEMVEVRANEMNPGAIATYHWEVIPLTAGKFTNPAANNTTFQALEEGEVIIRLTASDGLYQSIATCPVVISGVLGLAVTLIASPQMPEQNQVVLLTCTSIGSTDAVELSVVQIEGPAAELLPLGGGSFVFDVPDALGDLVFRCVGGDAEGNLSEEARVTVTVVPSPDNENANANVNANANANANANDNAASNTNGNGNQNSNANVNDNER